jgi:hypothetical protein
VSGISGSLSSVWHVVPPVKKNGLEVGPLPLRPRSSRANILRPQRIAVRVPDVPALKTTSNFPDLGIAEKIMIGFVNVLFLVPPIRGRAIIMRPVLAPASLQNSATREFHP